MNTAAHIRKKEKVANKILYLSQGFFDGRPTWHFLLVDKLKLPLLLKDSKKGEIDLACYGNIIFSGFGANPPDEVRHFVKKKYANSGQS